MYFKLLISIYGTGGGLFAPGDMLNTQNTLTTIFYTFRLLMLCHLHIVYYVSFQKCQ